MAGQAGLIAPGNIDLRARPRVQNGDGTFSTVRSISIDVDGHEVLIPTVSDDGRVLSNADAIALFRRTGKHLGAFDSPAHATAYAQQLHQDQAKEYGMDDQEIVIVGPDGTEHVFPAGFSPKRAAAIVRNGGNGELPSQPVSAEDFTKPSAGSEAIQQLKDVGLGALKGLGSTAAGISEAAVNAGAIPGVPPSAFQPEMRHPLFQQTDKDLTATNTPQQIGKVGEQAAELAVPLYQGGKAALALAGKAGPLAMGVAEHLPVVGRPLRIVRALSRLLPDEAKSANAGGRLVAGQPPEQIEQVVADALGELRQPGPPAKISTAPEPQLPAGYTPRSSAPAAKVAEPPAAPASAPQVGRGAFVDVDAKGLSGKDVGRDWHAYGSESERSGADAAERARMQGLHRDAGALDQRYQQLIHDKYAGAIPAGAGAAEYGRRGDRWKRAAAQPNALEALIALLRGT